MNPFAIDIAPAAFEALGTIDAWWAAERPSAPQLFVREFSASLQRLARSPFIGVRYSSQKFANVRRLLMPRTRYHVYYAVDEIHRVVNVIAVWHAARGKGPLGL